MQSCSKSLLIREVKMTTQSPDYANSMNHNTDGDELVVELYDANKGKLPRDGGPYLDDIEKEQAELLRAKREDREPDFDNPPASAGTVLVPKSQLVERSTDKSHFSDTLAVENEPVASYVADNADGFSGDPDPKQGDWNNDSSQLNALKGAVEFDEFVAKKNTPDPEPQSMADPEYREDV